MVLFIGEIAFELSCYKSMQLSETIKMREIELILQTAFKFCICLQTNWKSQFDVMVECFVYELSGCGFESCCSHSIKKAALRKSYKVT